MFPDRKLFSVEQFHNKNCDKENVHSTGHCIYMTFPQLYKCNFCYTKKKKKKKSGDKVLYSLMLSEGSNLFYPFKK